MKEGNVLRKAARRKRIIMIAIVIVLLVIIGIVVYLATSQEEPPVEPEIITSEEPTTATTTTTTTATTTTTIDYTMKLDLNKVKDAKKANPDVVGWIYVDDTVIDYPVVQADDNDHYLHLDWKGEYSYSGCIFEDYRGEIEKTANTLFYGHNMGNGSMFHAIKNWEDKDWGKKHKYFEVATTDKRYLYKVISCAILNGLNGADFEYWNYEDLNKDEFKEYTDKIKNFSDNYYIDKKEEPKWGDKIIALQTCQTGANDGIRCVVFGKSLGEH